MWYQRSVLGTQQEGSQMNEEQRAKLLEILIETWNRQQSADEAFEEIDYLIDDIVDNAKRSVE